jgi:uncharacterized protein (DUF1778 family)
MSVAAKKSRAPKEPHEAVVNLRVPVAVRDLIDNAATMLGKTRTAFIIESSRKEAIDVMLDQRLFTLGAKQFDSFARALDETPASNEKLKRLMSGKSLWEK